MSVLSGRVYYANLEAHALKNINLFIYYGKVFNLIFKLWKLNEAVQMTGILKELAFLAQIMIVLQWQ